MNKIRPFGILYVDDEIMSLKYFRESFSDVAVIFTADNPADALQVFIENEHEIGLVLSDQKMPGGSGIDFLTKVREHNPTPLRILVTAYADFDTAVNALNDGLLYSYLSKPWNPEELESKLKNALDHYEVSHQRDNLLEEKSLAFQHLAMADKAASMSILSCGLNHHMRNALTAVHTFLELTPMKLEEELGHPPVDEEFWGDFYSQAHGQIDRMTGILTNLWEASNRRDLFVTDNIDIANIFREAGTLMVEQEDNIFIKVHSDPPSPLISGDTTKLSQMARLFFQEAKTNLVDGGEIEILIAPDTKTDGYRISFIDDGEPIAEEDLNRLFDPFYVRADKPNEFGMNMVACYLTVFHHGGTMTAHHLKDGRNAIIFTLPRVAIRPAARTKISRDLMNEAACEHTVAALNS
ncbi:MAG: hybrid sensor histidine kinase/response regulator [Verrucomicrobiales bacterium]|nr:hybrid sensor histidine kinase/response regulator [Verrucomicrobiales bacterium]